MKLAGCVIKDSGGRVLLIHRKTPKRVQWEIPGGKVEPGETPEQAAVRELKEELNVDVVIIRQIGTKNFKEDGDEYEYHWFGAAIRNGKLRIVETDKFDELGYFTFDEMHMIFDELSANTKNLAGFIKYRES